MRRSYRIVLTEEERERLLQLLHKPTPPGPLKDLDVRIIQKIEAA